MKRIFPALICLAAVAAGGCGSRWAMDVMPSEPRLAWPQSPEKAKIRHVTTIKGFKERGASLKMLFAGKSEDKFMTPVAVAAGRDGRIAVADTGTKSVHLFLPKDERYVRVFGAGSDELESPVSVAFDDDLRLYVSDTFLGKVYVYDDKGKYLGTLDAGSGGGVLMKPTGIAYDRKGKTVFAVDTGLHRVQMLNLKGEPIASFGGRGSGDGKFNFPTHIAWSPAGRVYVTDAMNFRIQIFDASGKFISSFGRHGDGSGDFSMPKGVATDAEGTVYVVDTLFDNIQLFNERGEFLLTLGRRGTAQGEFWLPSGIFIDEGNMLYVCDTYNQRVQVFEITRDAR